MVNLAVSRTGQQARTEAVAPPDTKSLAYKDMETMWQMLRTVMAGTDAMRAAGEQYMPRFPAESKAVYAVRLQRAVLTNHFEDAVRQAASLPFKKPVDISDDTPGWLKDIATDIDLGGLDISQFSRKVLEDGIIAGFSFILVDFTRTDGEVKNLAEERAVNARPYWVHIRADDMLAIYINRIDGEDVVTHARFREVVNERDGFNEKAVEQIRVMDRDADSGLCTFQVWQKGSTGWAPVDSGPLTVNSIPIVPVMCGREATGRFVVKPLFLDLAHKQVEHWQSSSDQRNILTYGRFPMLAVSGVGADNVDQLTPDAVGPAKILSTSDPHGKWYYVEPEGHAIEAGRKDLECLSEEMRILGLQPTVGTPGSITATARALDEARVHSAVQVLALNLEGALNEALQRTLDWQSDSGTTAAYVNRDFGISLRDSREIDALLRSRVAGELSRRTFWSELKRRNVLAVDFDADEEQTLLDTEVSLGITIPGAVPPTPPGVTEFNTQVAALNKVGGVGEGDSPLPAETQAGP